MLPTFVRTIALLFCALLASLAPAGAQTLTLPQFGVDRTATPWKLYHFGTTSQARGLIGTIDPGTGATVFNPSTTPLMLPLAGGTLTGDLLSTFSFITKSSPTCLTTTGTPPTDGTQSWQPTCFGVWLNNDNNAYTVYPTRGTTQINGVPSSNMTTGALFQSKADGNQINNYDGIGINFESEGGTISAQSNPQNNMVSLFDSIRQFPDTSGHRPPNTWGLNIDFHIAPGSGNVESWLQELDLNNFNTSCGVGTGCISAWIWFNGISAFANLAQMYGGGATVTNFAGLATTSGKMLTVSSFTAGTPQAFASDLVFVVVGGVRYHASYVDATHATTAVTLPTNTTAVAFTGSIAQSHFGYLLNGGEQVLEADLRFYDAATWGYQLIGNHVVGIDMASDTLTQAMNLGSGQTICWAVSSCVYGTAGNFVFQVGGVAVWFLDLNGGSHGSTGSFTSDVTIGGILQFGTYTGTTCTNAGYTTIKDSGGNVRKVMICS